MPAARVRMLQSSESCESCESSLPRVVSFKRHRVSRAALRGGPEVRRIPEHAAQRDLRQDHALLAAEPDVFNLRPARIQITEYVADVGFGSDDFDPHDGLEKARPGLAEA